MGNCATCCGKADTHEVDTTEKVKSTKLKAEGGYQGGNTNYGGGVIKKGGYPGKDRMLYSQKSDINRRRKLL